MSRQFSRQMRTRISFTRTAGGSDWQAVNEARFRAGDRIGITLSCRLDHWAATASPHRRTSRRRQMWSLGNDAMLAHPEGRAGPCSDARGGQPQSHGARAEGDRPLREGRRDRHQASGEPPSRRSAVTRSDRPAVRRGRPRPARSSTISGNTGGAIGHRRRFPMVPTSPRLASRHPKVRTSFWRTSVAAATTCTPLPQSADHPNILPDLVRQWRRPRDARSGARSSRPDPPALGVGHHDGDRSQQNSGPSTSSGCKGADLAKQSVVGEMPPASFRQVLSPTAA